jgi:MFS superfamily sulfate permease-like transporter
LTRLSVAGLGRVQNHVFALDTVARSGLDGEDRAERERASFALARADDDGSLEALGDADYHLVLEYKIGGPLTYVTASTHCKRFADISVDHVLLNLSHVTRIDLDGIAALEVAGSACARRWPWGNGGGCWRVMGRM